MAVRIDYLPDWFDLNNYLRFEDMSEVELLKELKLRIDIMNSLIVRSEYGHGWIYTNELGMWASIQKGNPSLTLLQKGVDLILKSQERELIDSGDSDYLKYKSAKEKLERFDCSFDSSVVKLVEVIDVEFITDRISAFREGLDIDAKKEPFEEIMFCDLAIDKLIDDQEGHWDEGMLHIKIDLKKATDKQILSSLEKLLPKYRKEFNFDGPDVVPSRSVDVEYMKRYRVLAYLDLFLWECLNNMKIRRTLLVESLYPGDDKKGLPFLEQTLKPFILKITTPDYLKNYINI